MNYWHERAVALENRTYEISKKNYKEIEKAFNKAQAEINGKIDKWYARLAENNNVSLEEAKKLLDKSELKEFKWTLDEYIKYGKENAIDQKWMKELENASAKFHISKLNAELLEIRAEYEKAFATENKVIEDTIKESYEDRYNHMAFEIQKGYGVGFKIAGVDSEKLDKVIKKPWAADGANFSSRVWKKKDQMVDTLHSELIRSMLVGGNTKEAIDIMKSYVRKDVKNAKYAAARLIRTESAYFASEGQKECFKDLDVEKYEIVATLDNKTSDICQGMDGQVFDMKDFEAGVTAPPFHVNCRSTTAPYFDDEFVKGERAARDVEGKTYYVPSDMTYKEWKEAQENLKDYKTQKTQTDNIIRFNKNSKEDKENIAEKEFKFNDITDSWTEKTKDGSYAECESVTLNGKTYTVGDNGVSLNIDARSKELEVANILCNKYGKEVVLLPEISGNNRGIHMPDLIVDGKLTEIKSITGTGKNTIKHNLSEAKKQAKDVIINIANDKIDVDNALKTIEKLFNDKQCDFMDSCILMKDGKIIKVLERNKIGTRNLQKQGVIPIIENFTIKIDKSQLQKDVKNDKIGISGEKGRSRNEIVKLAEDEKIKSVDYKVLTDKLTDEQIIRKISGGDKTEGSCASLAYAYIANKAGYDILDFRGGASLDFFSSPSVIKKIMNLDGVISYCDKDKDGIKVAKRILKNVIPKKDYLLSAGEHMAVIRKEDTGFKYLNLQSAKEEKNGWFDLNVKSLCDRFKYKKKSQSFGIKMDIPIELIDADSLIQNNTFKELLKYINTNEEEQLRGESGYNK